MTEQPLGKLAFILALSALLLVGCRLASPWAEPRGGMTQWQVPDEHRSAKHPWSSRLPAQPFGSSSVAWQSPAEIAYSSASGVSILDVEHGTFRQVPCEAYLLSASPNGVLAVATADGVVLAKPGESPRTVLPFDELLRATGLTVDGLPSEGPANDAGYIPVVECMAWSPDETRVAVLVQARSVASNTDLRSVVLVVALTDPPSCQIATTRDGGDGRVRLVTWLGPDQLLIFHNDYLEPDSDEGWALSWPAGTPRPTATLAALNLAYPGEVPHVLLTLPWHSRVSVIGENGVVGVFQRPRGPEVRPVYGSFLELPSGESFLRIPESIRPLTVPDPQGRYLALHDETGLVAVMGNHTYSAGQVSAGLLNVTCVGYWTDGLCASPDGTRVAEVHADRIRLYRCGW